MGPQLVPQAGEPHGRVVLRDPQLQGQLLVRAAVPVAPQKQHPVPVGQPFDKAVQGGPQLLGVLLPLWCGGPGQAVFQLREGHVQLAVPLAGPVVACAVILPKDCDILWLNDSKKLTAAKREELYDVIMKEAVAVGIGMADPERIDEINILQATYEAMRQAVSKLSVVPQLLLNDAVTIPEVVIPQVPIIKGDAKSVSIAAASIVAKVTRDRMMEDYDKIYPEYGFASNKGYGAQVHIDALKKYGPCPIHRRTFITHFV